MGMAVPGLRLAKDSGELSNYLSSSAEDNIEITTDRTYSELSFDSFVGGFHVYKDIWSLLIGEELNCKKPMVFTA